LNLKPFPALERFKQDLQIFIAGSTWLRDEELILKCIQEKRLKDFKYIIAPHQLNTKRLSELRSRIKQRCCLLSELTEHNAHKIDVIIVDTIGDLSSIYFYGDIAYIGGGFNAGVHNILEPAVYGLPIIFGPRYNKSLEAKELIKREAAFSANNLATFNSIIDSLSSKYFKKRTLASINSERYVKENLHGSEKVFLTLISLLNHSREKRMA
jgi:3-deoxy-D-manno-octulosonic-acid transferase